MNGKMNVGPIPGDPWIMIGVFIWDITWYQESMACLFHGITNYRTNRFRNNKQNSGDSIVNDGILITPINTRISNGQPVIMHLLKIF